LKLKKKLNSLLIKDSFDLIKKSDVVLFCSDNDRADKLNNKNYSRVLDTIYDDLISRGYDCINISLPLNIEVKNKSWGYVLSFNRSYFIAKINEKLSILINKLLFRKTNDSRKHIVQYYDNILKLSKPNLIFVIGCVPELAIAARNNNILIIEPLHGFGYTKVPWRWSEFNKEHLPNIIICFDAISANSFVELEKKDVKIYEINSMWLNRFKKENWNKLPDEWLSIINKLNNNKKNILVSLTWGYAGDHGDKNEFRGILSNGLIPESIIEIIKYTQDSINWYFRLHPKHLRNKNKYSKHFRLLNKLKSEYKNVEWEISTISPLPLVLETVSGVISMSSMVPYDAAYFGIKSLILCPTIFQPNSNPNFNDLISNGIAEYQDLNDEKLIYEWVLNIKRLNNTNNINPKNKWEYILDNILK